MGDPGVPLTYYIKIVISYKLLIIMNCPVLEIVINW